MTDKNICKTPDQLFSELIEKMRAYHPSSDLSLVEDAYALAFKAHDGQLRKSGEPYILHPLETSLILAGLELDRETIAAGILHDVIEDTPYSHEDLENAFGKEVAGLVEGVTKLDKISVNQEFKKGQVKVKNRAHRYMSKEQEQAENLRKMFLAMSDDIRVLLIKIADRVHNLRTLAAMPPEKQKRIAQESLDIYAPLAGRLGISTLRRELEDWAFKYSDNEAYLYIKEKVGMKVEVRQKHVDDIVLTLNMALKEQGLPGIAKGRAKHFFSIHRKIAKKQVGDISEIYDLFAVRILVDTVAQCWQALGLIHEIYPPLPNKLKNYVSNPKPNGYQSIHDVLLGPDGEPFEIQIRTRDMHKQAESGIAAHWRYKEGKTNVGGEDKIAWLSQVLELLRENDDNDEFLPLLKGELDIYGGFVHCYTPDGHVKVLAHGATMIDFAYAVHSAIGNTMTGAKVFGRIVPIDTPIEDGDRIEITTKSNAPGPKPEWLNSAKTSQAKNKIRQFLKAVDKDERIARGKELLSAVANEKRKGYTLEKVRTPEGEKIVLTRYSMLDFDTLCASIGRGAISERSVMNRLFDEYIRQNPEPELDPLAIIEEINKNAPVTREPIHKGDVIVQGADDLAVFYSKCCSPVPGDEIIGFTTRGRGVAIHRGCCANIVNLPESEAPRLIEAQWSLKNSSQSHFTADVKVICDGMDPISQVIDILQKRTLGLKDVNAKPMLDEAVCNAVISVANREDLEKVCAILLALKGVHTVERVMT